MTLAALDTVLLGPLFATDAMRAVFADAARVGAMLRAEAAPAPEALDPAALGRGTALSGVPIIPFVKAVQKALPPELEAAFHRGATTRDIADTGLVLQRVEALAAAARATDRSRAEIARLRPGPSEPALI